LDALRVVLVTSRFWPLADERSLRAMAVARRLAWAGAAVTVLTPQWDRRWSAQMRLDEVQVVRLRGAPRGGLASLRWYFHLARWLRQQRPQVVGILGMQQEAAVALAAARRGGWPTVLLADADDPAAWSQATLGRRVAAACRQAAAVVAPSARLAEELARFGLARIEVLPWAAETPPRPDALLRDAARRALAGVNPDLVAPPSLPVVLAVAPLAPPQPLEPLIGAWPTVVARRPDARLWIVGDGPLRLRLYRQIQDLDLRFRVLLPGTFDSLQELCHAADALLVPGASLAPPLALVEGWAAGLSVLAPRSPLGEALRSAAGRVYLFPPSDRAGIAQAVLDWLDRWQPPLPPNPALGAGRGPSPKAGQPAEERCSPAVATQAPPVSGDPQPPAVPPSLLPPWSPADEGQRLATLLRRVAGMPPSPSCHPAASPRAASGRSGQ
jgi:glycosyltransferase involved in cell wall biosynthesis